MYYVYVIKSRKHNYIYVDISDDPKRRMEQYNKRYNCKTRFYSPFKVVLIE